MTPQGCEETLHLIFEHSDHVYHVSACLYRCETQSEYATQSKVPLLSDCGYAAHLFISPDEHLPASGLPKLPWTWI